MIEEPGLIWSIKSSFIDYVSTMKDGSVSVAGGATRRDDGTFHFPLVPSLDPAVVRFRGTVNCTGHYGMLAISWSDVEIVEVDGRQWLTCADDEPGGRRTFLELPQAQPSGASVRFPRPVLTQDGADLFFDKYRPGTPFDPVLIVLGADAEAGTGAQSMTARPPTPISLSS